MAGVVLAGGQERALGSDTADTRLLQESNALGRQQDADGLAGLEDVGGREVRVGDVEAGDDNGDVVEEPDDSNVRRQLPDVADVPPGGEVVW